MLKHLLSNLIIYKKQTTSRGNRSGLVFERNIRHKQFCDLKTGH